MNPKTDWFFEKETKWKEPYAHLRRIVLACGLTEELKWGCPCYTYKNKNIVLIHGFNKYCALLFHKGVLLKDEKNILVQQTKHVQSARQVRFNDLKEIREQAQIIKASMQQGVEVDKSGLHVPEKKAAAFEVREEFKE